MFALLARPSSGYRSSGHIKGRIGGRLNGKYLIPVQSISSARTSHNFYRNSAPDPLRKFSASSMANGAPWLVMSQGENYEPLVTGE